MACHNARPAVFLPPIGKKSYVNLSFHEQQPGFPRNQFKAVLENPQRMGRKVRLAYPKGNCLLYGYSPAS
jgi:hypothetical protein